MNAGRLIRAARRRRSLSQAALAARAGTSQPVISAHEQGRRDPTTGTLRRLIAAAGEVLELHIAPTPPEIPPPADLDEHARRLLDVLSVADAVGHRPRRPLEFPRIEST